MTEKSLALFQDLNLRTRSADVAIRNAILKQVTAPWAHDPEREKHSLELRLHGEDVIAFTREPFDGIAGSSLMLWQVEDGYRVSNIVPNKSGELGVKRYNIILRDFVERIARPAAAEAGFKVDLTSEFQTLEAWVGDEVATKLRRFSSAANKSTGASHPMDQSRWFEFIIEAHKRSVRLDPDRLVRWLIEVERWPQDIAIELAMEYETSRALLEKYDEEA
ncbi:hypothetical protein [Rhizobacter fulvus]